MVNKSDHDFGTFFLQFFFEPCVCIFYALSPTIFLVIFFTTCFLPFSGQISGQLFGQIFGKLDTHQKLQNTSKKMWGMVRWEDFATYSARKLQNLAILPGLQNTRNPFFSNSGHIFGQIFGKLDTHQKLQNTSKKMWGMVRWEDFATYSARKLQNLAILPWSAKYTQPFFFRIRIVNFSYPKYWLVVAFSI